MFFRLFFAILLFTPISAFAQAQISPEVPIWGKLLPAEDAAVPEEMGAVGEAAREMFRHAKMAEEAARTGDKTLYDDMAWTRDETSTLESLWNDVVRTKMTITGSVENADCESCAALGLAVWAHRMYQLSGTVECIDVMERALYNGVLSGAGGNDCASCKANVARFLPTLVKDVYRVKTYSEDDKLAPPPRPRGFGGEMDPVLGEISMNLYVPGKTTFEIGEGKVDILVGTDFPKSGRVMVSCEPQEPEGGWTYHMIELEDGWKTLRSEKEMRKGVYLLRFRVPEWHGEKHVFKLYQNGNGYSGTGGSLRKEGFDPQEEAAYTHPHELTVGSSLGVCFHLNTKPSRIIANPRVVANRGRVAVQRGPMVYCFRQCDNGVPVEEIVLARDPEFQEVSEKEQPGGITVIKCKNADGRELTAVPYFVSGEGDAVVWVRQAGLTRNPYMENPQWKRKYTDWPILYRRLVPDMLTGDD